VPESVARSIYLQMDARLQAQAIALGGDVTYLAPGEVAKTTSSLGGYERAWELWKRKAMVR
jgi:HCOMODA/2-hydroxy-3-carboxy-muconic semialdehyde decarboxylase